MKNGLRPNIQHSRVRCRAENKERRVRQRLALIGVFVPLGVEILRLIEQLIYNVK